MPSMLLHLLLRWDDTGHRSDASRRAAPGTDHQPEEQSHGQEEQGIEQGPGHQGPGQGSRRQHDWPSGPRERGEEGPSQGRSQERWRRIEGRRAQGEGRRHLGDCKGPSDKERKKMGLILIVLLLALIFAGLGFAVHALWIIAVILFVFWLVGFALGKGRKSANK